MLIKHEQLEFKRDRDQWGEPQLPRPEFDEEVVRCAAMFVKREREEVPEGFPRGAECTEDDVMEALAAMKKMHPAMGARLAQLSPFLLSKHLYIKSDVNCLLDGQYDLVKMATTHYSGTHYPIYSRSIKGSCELLLCYRQMEDDLTYRWNISAKSSSDGMLVQ